MKIINVLLATILMLIFCACASIKSTSNPSTERSLKELMTGSFSSTKQAQADSTYYDITLQMYPIWTARKGDWLYVEQAATQTQDKPYRQRIYQLKQTAKNEFESIVYRLKDEENFVGKWASPDFFDQFDERILEEREGCTVYLKKVGNEEYTGSTLADHCKSTLRGATYASSIVTVKNGVILSWDQGFDAEGKQVWGATKGGYIFEQ